MSSAIVGVIIGGVFTLLGGILGQVIIFKLNIKNDNRAELKHVYEEMEKYLYILQTPKQRIELSDIQSPLEAISGKMILYCRADIVDKWSDIANLLTIHDCDMEQVCTKCKEMLEIMRRDLGIKCP